LHGELNSQAGQLVVVEMAMGVAIARGPCNGILIGSCDPAS